MPSPAEPNCEGYDECYPPCVAAFPGREVDCNRSCKQSNGIEDESDQPPITPGGTYECDRGRCNQG